MLPIKYDQDRSQRYLCLKVSECGILFGAEGHVTPVTSQLLLAFKLVPRFVLVTCKFDKDLINTECDSMETSFSHCKYGNFFWCKSVRNSKLNCLTEIRTCP